MKEQKGVSVPENFQGWGSYNGSPFVLKMSQTSTDDGINRRSVKQSHNL